jgi:hypothetical protein
MAKSLAPQDKFATFLSEFADRLTDKFFARAAGEPEDQLKSPVDHLFISFGKITSQHIVLKGESHLKDRLGSGEVITAGSAVVALSSFGSKAFKQAAAKKVKLQSSAYALLYRMKSN